MGHLLTADLETPTLRECGWDIPRDRLSQASPSEKTGDPTRLFDRHMVPTGRSLKDEIERILEAKSEAASH